MFWLRLIHSAVFVIIIIVIVIITGYCESCTEPIIGMENGCVALKNTYHVKCFHCYKCGEFVLAYFFSF